MVDVSSAEVPSTSYTGDQEPDDNRDRIIGYLGNASARILIPIVPGDMIPSPAGEVSGISLLDLMNIAASDPRKWAKRINDVWFWSEGDVKRLRNEPRPLLRFMNDDLIIDRDAREVEIIGVNTPFTRKEFDLLTYLAETPGVVHSRRDLLHDVWGSDTRWQSVSTVTEHKRRVSLKFEDAGIGCPIETVRGVGYKFVDPTLVEMD